MTKVTSFRRQPPQARVLPPDYHEQPTVDQIVYQVQSLENPEDLRRVGMEAAARLRGMGIKAKWGKRERPSPLPKSFKLTLLVSAVAMIGAYLLSGTVRAGDGWEQVGVGLLVLLSVLQLCLIGVWAVWVYRRP